MIGIPAKRNSFRTYPTVLIPSAELNTESLEKRGNVK